MKLRKFCENPLNTMRVFAIYDCSNSPFANYKGMYEVLGRGDDDGVFYDPNKKQINNQPCPYMHLSPAKPSGKAAANASNA